jgi:arylsulfatase A-like enzyme
MISRSSRAVVAVSTLLACLAGGCRAPEIEVARDAASAAEIAVGTPAGRAVGPAGPIVVISIDTLRADRLPAYGYEAVATPAIDRLRRDAVLFEHAFAHAPTTLPSHSSLFTGRFPSRHGVRDNVGYTLAEGTVTLAARLGDIGYRTAGFVSAYPLRGEAGIGTGFSTWDDEFDATTGEAGIGEIQRGGADTVERARAWLEGQTDGVFFLFVHLFEPHLPYTAPEPFKSANVEPYDAEVAYADSLVGELFAALEANGFYDDATVVLLADHGEGLGDHGEDDHGIFVYTSTLSVPLLLKLPTGEGAGTSVAEAVQLADVAPTLAALAGAEALPGADGRDLFAAGTSARTIYAETYQPRIHFGWSELRTVIEYPYQYIEAPAPELYDLAADPAQSVNLVAGEAQIVARLRDAVADHTVALQAPAVVDQATRDRLAALGYVSAGAAETSGDLADPKARIHLLRRLKLAADMYFRAEYEAAIVEYEAVLREDPEMPAAWEWLGRAQHQAGHLADAVTAYEMLLSLGGGTSNIDLLLAQLHLDLGDHGAAAAAANRLLTEYPIPARLVLAQIALAEGRNADALQLARRVLTDDAAQAGAHLVVAEALLQTGDLAAAGPHLDAAQRDPALTGRADVLRGRVLMMGGQTAAAQQAFSRAAATNPELLGAHVYLAATFFVAGDPGRGIAALEEMVRLNPTVDAELRAIDTLERFGLGAQASRWRQNARARHPEAGQVFGG